MKVCVVREKSLKEFNNTIKPSLQKIDLVLFSLGAIPEISYENEILNKTKVIKEIVNLSKELHASIIMPSIFNLFEEKQFSVLICENGKIIDIVNENIKNKIHLFLLNKKRLALFNLNEIFKDEIVDETMKCEIDIACIFLNINNIKTLSERLKYLQKKYNCIYLVITPKCLLIMDKENNEIDTNFNSFFVKDF